MEEEFGLYYKERKKNLRQNLWAMRRFRNASFCLDEISNEINRAIIFHMDITIISIQFHMVNTKKEG
jgi:hypothetical protein